MFSFLVRFAFPSFAQSDAANTDAAMLTPSPTPVQYDLPYPGLLPDNFLYKLKTLRDKLISFLISDPLKKVEFDILQADKRYNAALYLYQADAKKEEIILSTISKADNYVDEAIGQLFFAKQQGQNIVDLTNKLILSNRKHREVLQNMEKSASASLKKQLKQEEARIAQLQTRIKKEFHLK